MSKLEFLDQNLHGQLRVDTRYGAEFGHATHLVPVMAVELPRLIAQCPVFLVKQPETGEFLLAAMTGFGAEENLFLEGEAWTASYVPLHIRRGPFSVSQREAEGQVFLAPQINREDSRVGTTGEALFDAAGEATPYLAEMNSVLATLVDNGPKTKALIQSIVDNQLIEIVKLDVSFKDGSRMRFDNLYSIKQDAVLGLPAHKLAELNVSGHLRDTYFILASLSQVSNLIDRKNASL